MLSLLKLNRKKTIKSSTRVRTRQTNKKRKMKKTLKKMGNNIDISKLEFKKSDIIGEGTFSSVYKFRYKNKINDKYVVKKIKVHFLRPFFDGDMELYEMFIDEVDALIYLDKHGVTPKIYGVYVDLENDEMYYILEKLDCSLGDMLRNKTFKSEYVSLFIDVIVKLIKTKYRHTDLHIENVMFNKNKNKFYLIDFGKQRILTKMNKEGLFFTQGSNSDEDIAFISMSKDLKQGVMGTSGFSALGTVYRYVFNRNDKHSKEALKKIRELISKIVPKRKYAKIIEVLESGKNYF